MRIQHFGPIVALLLLMAPSLQASEVQYQGGRMTIRCNNESLGQLFEQIKAATGMELILDGAVKNTRLTADIAGEPLNIAIERLMEGSGLNYVLLMDRADWQRVAKMFITNGGSSGGGNAAAGRPGVTPAPTARRPLPRETEEDEPDLAPEEPAPADDPGAEAAEDAGQENAPPQAPPVAQPAPNYLPPPQNFPRSSVTPGFDKNPFGAWTGQPATGNPNGANPYGTNPYMPPGSMTPPGATPNAPPPANFPFVDAFGRPIPVNPQQNQNQNKNPK